MTKFDKKYFDDIWGHIGGIHRHDYTESLANRLIQQYGKVRFLDIGTGCGELVRVLREKGCEAYGIDVSEYAVANSHGNVLLGDVQDLPFKDDSFDVVHSNGLWDYVAEEDIKQAWAECNRVGKLQDHNIDTILDTAPWTKDFATHKSREWWDERMQIPKVLVSCPVFDGKAYCFDEWVKMVKSLTYPNYDILVVDNSKTEDFYNIYKDQIPMKHLIFDPEEKDDNMYRVCKSMAEVQRHFLKGNYTHWMNIEADVIPPSDVIETLMKYGRDCDWTAHVYPQSPSGGWMAGIGCSLLSRKLMTDFDWDDTTIADDSPDSELWSWVQSHGGYKTAELYYIMDVKHLK